MFFPQTVIWYQSRHFFILFSFFKNLPPLLLFRKNWAFLEEEMCKYYLLIPSVLCPSACCLSSPLPAPQTRPARCLSLICFYCACMLHFTGINISLTLSWETLKWLRNSCESHWWSHSSDRFNKKSERKSRAKVRTPTSQNEGVNKMHLFYC